jgi:hypothetical protein
MLPGKEIEPLQRSMITYISNCICVHVLKFTCNRWRLSSSPSLERQFHQVLLATQITFVENKTAVHVQASLGTQMSQSAETLATMYVRATRIYGR